MRYSEFKELKQAYLYKKGNQLVKYGYDGPSMKVSYGQNQTYRESIRIGPSRYDISWGFYELLPFSKPLVKFDEIETYSGAKYVVMNNLKHKATVSCLAPGTKTGRFHVSVQSILKVNGKIFGNTSPILLDLLSL